MKLRNTGIPLIIDDIIEVEKRMDLLFPTEFKDFYLQHNGGNPECLTLLDKSLKHFIDSLL